MTRGVRALLAVSAALLFLASGSGRAAGFFDGVPRRGYLKADVSLDVLDVAAGQAVVARVRYVRLALDPGRRDIAWDHWPEREMLLEERTTGEKLVFERLSKLPDPDPSTPAPRGRIGLAGTAVETFARPASAGSNDPCAALDLVIHAGNVEIPVASADLEARTVRVGIAQAVEGAFGPNERELIAQTVPVLVAAQSQGLSATPLEVLDILFPGQPFARAAQGLSFRPSGGALLNPADGAWRSVTDAPRCSRECRCTDVKTLAFLAALVTASAPAAPASAVDPELTVFRVEAAAAVRLVKEMTGGPALEDVYMPMTLLWQAADPTDLKPRGRVTLEKGPFSGEDFARLARAATDELGRR